MAMATSEPVWIRSFLASLGIFHTKPMKLSYDNQASLRIAKNLVFHECTKHMELDCHFVHESLEACLLGFSYIITQYQPVDIFTKALKKKQFQYLITRQVGPDGPPHSNLRGSEKETTNPIPTTPLYYIS